VLSYQTTGRHSSGAWRRAGSSPRLAVAVAMLAIAVLSLPAFAVPFLNDMDAYAHHADKILRGGLLYRDTLDTKPPFVVLQYALIFWAARGTSLAGVKLVTMAILGVSALVLRRLWSELFPSSPGGDLVLLLFVLASFCGWGEDFLSSNTEIPANLFILLGVWCMTSRGFAWQPGRLVLAGALIGVAFLYRFQAGAPLAAYALLVLCHRPGLSRGAARLALLAVGFVVPATALVAYYAHVGALDSLLLVVRLDYFYIRGAQLYWPAAGLQVLTAVVSQAPILALGLAEAVFILRSRRWSTSEAFLLLYLAVSLVTFFVGKRFFAHYLIASIPPLVLLIARRLVRIRATAPSRPVGLLAFCQQHAGALIAAYAAVFWVVNLGYFATRPPEPVYPNLARLAQAVTTREDPVFVWTTKTHLLFAIDRAFATRFVSNDFLVGRMYGTRHRLPTATAESARPAAVAELWPLLLHDLERVKPRLIVDDTRETSQFTLDRYPELQAFVERGYEPCRVVDGFCVYVRKGIRHGGASTPASRPAPTPADTTS
jgi:hypothetical protein